MHLFRSYNLTWQQIGVFKVALLSIGVLIGAYASNFVKDFTVVFALIAVASTGYVVFVATRQAAKAERSS